MCNMNQLPPELIALLCSFLHTPSLQTFRRTCKAYAAIGEALLFDGFGYKLLPRRHSLDQLEQLTAHPTIAPRLICLAYETGVQLEYADFRYWQANIYQRISNARSNGLTGVGMSKEEYAQFHAALQARFTADMPVKFELYRWHLDHEATMMAQSCGRSKLVRIMNTLSERSPNLKLKIIMSEPQIELPELEAFNPQAYAYDLTQIPDLRRRVIQRRANTLAHFTHFLSAANQSTLRVTDLEAISLPHQLLNPQTWPTLASAFLPLHALTLTLSALPHSAYFPRSGITDDLPETRNRAAAHLASLLNVPTNLFTLHLKFPQEDTTAYSFAIFSAPRWLPTVHTLSLSHISCPCPDLLTFLRSAVSLRDLSLRHISLTSGSLIFLLEFLPRLSLSRISLQGSWPVREDGGTWHSHTEGDFSECTAVTTYEGPYLGRGLRWRVEEMALGGGACPLGRERGAWEEMGDTSWHFVEEGLERR